MPKPPVCISAAALEVLIDEPPELSKLYLCLVQVMDYDTCIAGISYRINQQFLSERLSVAGINGRKYSKPSRQKIRSVLTRMFKIKLIVDQGKHVFLLPFEKAHCSDQNRYNRRYNPISNPIDSSINTDDSITYTNLETSNNPSNNRRYNPPLYNNINNSNLGIVDESFCMSLEWECNRTLIKSYLGKRGDDPSQIDLDWMVEFQGFWSGKPHVLRTQHAWDIKLANYLSKFIRHPELFKQLNGLSDPSDYPSSQNTANARSSGFIPAVPRADDALMAYAKQHDFPAVGDTDDSYAQYRGKLIAWRTARLDTAQQLRKANT